MEIDPEDSELVAQWTSDLVRLFIEGTENSASLALSALDRELSEKCDIWFAGVDDDGWHEYLFEELMPKIRDALSTTNYHPLFFARLVEFVLRFDGLGEVGYCIAQNPHCPPGVLHDLFESEYGWEADSTRERIAANPNISDENIDRCIESNDSDILWCLASNPGILKEWLVRLLKNEETSWHALEREPKDTSPIVGIAARINLEAIR